MSTPEHIPGESAPPRLALIAGPTASGKSALALALAEHANGVVINADASQVYADLSVLSARPTQEEMARAPHRVFGFMDGAEACSAARWAEEAKREIAAAHAAGRLPILVGGTGLYIRTLLDGIAPVPEIDPEVRFVFGYPGGAVLPIYDALFQRNDIRHMSWCATNRARPMAEGYARSTGKPGVVLVTSGPGATNALPA
jgi:tRNA A37 N6-isopentenylltransferase MiaA